jgi:hypothetical protein
MKGGTSLRDDGVISLFARSSMQGFNLSHHPARPGLAVFGRLLLASPHANKNDLGVI